MHLYDYRMHLPELKDKFHIHGTEFKTSDKKETAAETRSLRKAREAKEKTIGLISYKMLV